MSIITFVLSCFTARSLRTSTILLALVLTAHATYAVEPNNTPFNGVVSGAFSVAPTGAATYSIPIELPPGIGGMAPQLSLNYNSQAGNGLLGVGWSMGGLSAVTRCPATLVQDGFMDPVDFDANDRFCLDGQRLIQVTNTGCAGGTEYRTEIDSYARICAYADGAVSPAWFEVRSKSGLVTQYGASDDSRIEAEGRAQVLVWAFNRTTDTSDNYMEAVYYENNATGEYYPVNISYTGNAVQNMAGHHAVRLNYVARSDTASGYVGGSVVNLTKRLQSLEVIFGNSTIGEYRLTYLANEFAEPSRISSVTRCAYSVSGVESCQAPLDIEWPYGGGTTPGATWGAIATGTYNNQTDMVALDFNADGRTDIARLVVEGTSVRLRRWNSTGTGFQYKGAITVSSTNTADSMFDNSVFGDFNRDGLIDMAQPAWNNCYVYLGNASGTMTYAGIWATGVGSPAYWSRAADVNGDGLTDLLVFWGNAVLTYISSGSDFQLTQNLYLDISTQWLSNRDTQVADMNGDGRQDLVLWSIGSGSGLNKTDFYVMLSTGTGYGYPVRWGTGHDADASRLRLGDVNGDGLPEPVQISSGGAVHVWKNTRTALGNRATWATGLSSDASAMQLGDFNADGKADVLEYRTDGTSRVRYSNGSTLGGYIIWSYGHGTDAKQRQLGDFNGDGLTDLLRFVSATNTKVWRTYPGEWDQVSAIRDGVGTVVDIRYKSLANSATDPGAASVLGPRQVVGGYTVTSGAHVRSWDMTYATARADFTGRGFLGFNVVTATDNARGVVETATYSQNFPHIGDLISREERLITSQQTITYEFNSLMSTSSYSGVKQVFVFAHTQYTYDPDGTLISTVQTINQERDDYGNPTTMVASSWGGGETYTKTTTSIYDNDTAQWRIGRLLSSSVTSTGPPGADTRTSGFEYSPTTGLLSAEIIEPNDPQLMLRTEYGYDGYGNKSSVTVRDSGANDYPITTATSTTGYDYGQLDVDGTYIITSTNAKLHTETQVIDVRFGKPLHLTGPNGLTTSWEYDAFGRQKLETRPDGTQTSSSFFWCDSGCSGMDSSVYAVVTQVSGAPEITVYYDGLGREVRTRTVDFQGNYVYRDTTYNVLGQVESVSRPRRTADAVLTTDYLYDVHGRVVSETMPDGGITETTYSGLITRIHRYSGSDYDQTVIRETNVEGNLKQVTDEGNRITRYEYDPFGNLSRVIDPVNNQTVMFYDRRGRKTSMDDPDMGHWEYRYDALGQLRWQKDAKNQEATMSYDVLGRMVSRVEPEGTSRWIYDTSPTPGVGKLWKVTGPDGYVEQHYYDMKGRPFIDVQIAAGVTLTTTTVYDGFGRVDALTYPSGFRLKHEYTASGYLEKVSNADNVAEVYWTAQGMSADGQVSMELMGNGLSTVRTLDPASGRMTYLTTGVGAGSAVQNLFYDYDALGNLRERTDVNGVLTEIFQYDEYNRLTDARIDQNGVTIGSKSWAYDGLGNIEEKDGFTDYDYGPAGSAKPHAVKTARGSSYAYDANGNMETGGGRTITWNSANLPTRIVKGGASADFSYGPDRVRYRQVSTSGGVSTTTLYLGKLYEQVNTNGVVTHKNYIAAAGRVVAVREIVNGAATMKYLHQDHLGSTDVITDANGQVLERQSFDAFGARRIAADWRDPIAWISSLYSTRGFSGHEQLDGVGLIHMNGRVYDPELGRFLSADPIVKYPAGAQGLNRYSYVDNNPLSRVDPSGYGWLSKLWSGIKSIFKNSIVRAVVGIAVGAFAYAYVGLLTSNSFLGTLAGGFTAGVVSTGTLQGGLIGAATALMFYPLHSLPSGFGKTLAHGAVGGVRSRLLGGSFREGFLSAGFTQAFSGTIGGFKTLEGRLTAAAVVGGTAAELGGGKFANGAVTGAFSRLFGEMEAAPRKPSVTFGEGTEPFAKAWAAHGDQVLADLAADGYGLPSDISVNYDATTANVMYTNEDGIFIGSRAISGDFTSAQMAGMLGHELVHVSDIYLGQVSLNVARSEARSEMRAYQWNIDHSKHYDFGGSLYIQSRQQYNRYWQCSEQGVCR